MSTPKKRLMIATVELEIVVYATDADNAKQILLDEGGLKQEAGELHVSDLEVKPMTYLPSHLGGGDVPWGAGEKTIDDLKES